MHMSSVQMRLRNSIGALAMGVLVLALTTRSAQSATRVVSGYLSGLNRGESVTLLQNGEEALTVTTNGIFNFATPLASGAAYEVTVGTQPASEVCTVDSAGSGIVPEAGVTQLQVSCASGTDSAADTTPATTTGWWIPYTATPQTGKTGGLTGLFLIASNLIHSSPTQEFIATTTAKIIGEGVKITAAGLAGAQPMNLMYSAVGTDGNTHLYGVAINNTAAVPTPAQITTLSLTSAQTICGTFQAQTSLTNAATLFIVLNVSKPPCGTNPSTYYVVHYKDTPTTKPKKVSIATTQISPLYNNGALVGLYLYNAATKSLNYYATDAFTTPTELVTSITGFTPIASTAKIANGTTFGATVFFPAVTGVAVSGNALYSIESTSPGTAKLIHKGTVSQGVVDNANLYFQDTSSSTAAVFYQVGLTASTPIELYSGSVIPSLSSYTLIGTDTVRLAFMESVLAPTSQATFSTIPIGALVDDSDRDRRTLQRHRVRTFPGGSKGQRLGGQQAVSHDPAVHGGAPGEIYVFEHRDGAQRNSACAEDKFGVRDARRGQRLAGEGDHRYGRRHGGCFDEPGQRDHARGLGADHDRRRRLSHTRSLRGISSRSEFGESRVRSAGGNEFDAARDWTRVRCRREIHHRGDRHEHERHLLAD